MDNQAKRRCDQSIDFNGIVNLSKVVLYLEVRELHPLSVRINIEFVFCTEKYDIKYSYLIQIICTQLYGFWYSYLKLIIIWFQVIISI